MEKNKYIFLQKRTLIIILLISLFNILSCSTDSLNNENPKLSIDTITNFLDITMTGYAIDADGTISKVTIDWGDNYIDNLNESEKSMEIQKTEIGDTLQSLSAIAEENAASTEETSATTEEQSASMHEIERSSEVLSELAVDLQNSIQKFKY